MDKMDTPEKTSKQSEAAQQVEPNTTNHQSTSNTRPATCRQSDNGTPQVHTVKVASTSLASKDNASNGAVNYGEQSKVVTGENYKKRQMDSQQCLSHSQTSPGALPLTNPSGVKNSNKDSNKGLYPRQPPMKARRFSPMKARSPMSPRRRRSPKEIPNQSRLDAFFPPVDPIEGDNDSKEVGNVQGSSSPQLPHVKRSLPFSNKNPSNTSGASSKMPSSPKASSKLSNHGLHPRFQRYTPPRQSTPRSADGHQSPKNQTAAKYTSPKPPSTMSTPPKHSKAPSSMSTPPKHNNKAPSSMGRLVDDFNNDTHYDSMDVEAIVSQAESNASSTSSPMKSSQDILDEFENDTSFESSAMWNILEKAESETSSPCKANTYGLLGEGASSDSEDDVDVDHFARLPIEVMENIFCRLPMMDLCLDINVVCKAWNEIISKDKFLYWKKRYHKYKIAVDSTCIELYEFIQEHTMVKKENFLLQIIEFVEHFRNWYGSSMLKDLQHHHIYQLADDLIKERAPHLIKDTTISPWCMIAIIAVLSSSVSDVTLILTCLLNPMATCRAIDVIECLYCVATLLLVLERRHNTNRGLHYQVFYALYLYENSFSDIGTKPSLSDNQQSPGQQSLWRYGPHSAGVRLTHEQVRIVAYDPKPQEVVKIVAFAGSGKTTTLIKYAQRRPHMKFLYVAFNRAVKEHAQQVFPPNVTSKTTHSLAYATVGYKYKNQFAGNLRPKYLHKLLPPTSKMDKAKKTGLHWITRSKLVIDTLTTFMNSTDDFITTLHVPNSMPDKETGLPINIPHSDQMKLADDASNVWEKLIDVSNKEARIIHDVYLKLYQLNKPEIYQYDCILIDEAQDLTPVQQDILLRQHCAKILVGDPNQQIYSFRGASNAMDDVVSHIGPGKVIKTFHLTQSFRFGPEIAYVANVILELFKGIKFQSIVGKEEPGGIFGDEVGAVAIICRTNVELFDQAVRICDEATAKKERTKIGFAGGVSGYGLDMILDIYLMYLPYEQRRKDPRKIENPFIKGFTTFQDLKSYATKAVDVELENKIAIVQKYNVRIPTIIADIHARETHTDYADIILSTAHKSKGLEFDTVKLTEDYNALHNFLLRANGQAKVRICADELNLVYVAITRAKKRLVLNHSLMKVLEYAHENFIYPVSTKSVLAKHDTVPKCLDCRTLIEANNEATSTVMIAKKPKLQVCFTTTASIMPTHDGYLCGSCTADQCRWYRGLCRTKRQMDDDTEVSQDSAEL